MFRYCSSVAFMALLAVGCSSNKDDADDDDNLGAGGGGFQFSGGATSTGGAGNLGGTTDIPPDNNLQDITKVDWDAFKAESCTGWSAEGEMVPANIEFIVDTSGSMKDVSINTQDGRSKWDITRTALEEAIKNLPRRTSVGMLLWPNKATVPNHDTEPFLNPGGVSWCVNVDAMVPMNELGASGSDHRNLLAAALAAVVPQGGTPMADAYNYAIENTYGANFLKAGERYAVLITDGQPTIQFGCMGTGEEKRPEDEKPVLDAIAGSLANIRVKTFVIGSPGSEAQSSTGADGRGWLSQAAQNGGTKAADNCQNSGPNYCHFDMSQSADFATGFSSALRAITGQILGCKYKINQAALNGEEVNPDKVSVLYQVDGSEAYGDMKLVGKATDPNCPEGNGWFFDPDDPNGLTILLCPMTCERVQQDSGAVLDIAGGCDPIIQIN